MLPPSVSCAAVFADDAVLREAGRPDEIRGREAIRSRAAALLAAFPDFHLQRILLLVDGERHADRWVMTGTHRGELFGIAPTGRQVRVEGATFTRGFFNRLGDFFDIFRAFAHLAFRSASQVAEVKFGFDFAAASIAIPIAA